MGEQVSENSGQFNQVLFLAGQIAGCSGSGNAEHVAQERGWIDTEGQVTEAGRDLLAAFAEQRGTRSVFRPMF